MREFIKTRPCLNGKKYCIILGNASWHKKAIHLTWIEALNEYFDIRENMEYISLPPYSPDLNSIEQFRRIMRREKHTTTIFLH
ncbi:MAG: transposase [Acetatifactor sp.]|nr:transposase [Acetatifactor sp.]